MSSIADVPRQSLCGGETVNDKLTLRIMSIFVILITSMLGAFFPIVSRRVKKLHVHESIYTFCRYFGSGVIVSTAFVHLLAPAFTALSSPCLSEAWRSYDWAAAIVMCASFAIFLIDFLSHRAGAKYLRRRGLTIGTDPNIPHGCGAPATLNIDAESDPVPVPITPIRSVERGIIKSISTDQINVLKAPVSNDQHEMYTESAISQIIAVFILEFGIIFHSMIIGLTLAVSSGFEVFFIAIVFHQMFEGLGLGARLAILPLPKKYNWVAYAGATAYSVVTPLGVAIGLAVRTNYDPDSEVANIVSGVLDALSAGILIYTGLVELLAHDFIFNRHMAVEASDRQVAFALGSVMLGAGLMSVIGQWA